MDKIIKMALESKGFSNETADIILEIAGATGNTEVAVSKLLGIYEPPVIANESGVAQKERDSNSIATFISFNPYKNEVKYSYQSVKRIYQDGKYVDNPEGIKETMEDICSLDRWNRFPV